MKERHEPPSRYRGLLDGRTFARAGLEVFSIVLGVLLALAVSEWQEDRHNRERTAAALLNVRAELEGNLQILEIVHSNNVALVDRVANKTMELTEDDQFLPALQISDSAWTTLNTTGLANFVDLDLMATLSETYSLMEVYRRAGYSLVDANMTVLATATAAGEDIAKIDDTSLFALNFVRFFKLIVDVESALMESHKSALASRDLYNAD
jgi:hypothetical protein